MYVVVAKCKGDRIDVYMMYKERPAEEEIQKELMRYGLDPSAFNIEIRKEDGHFVTIVDWKDITTKYLKWRNAIF